MNSLFLLSSGVEYYRYEQKLANNLWKDFVRFVKMVKLKTNYIFFFNCALYNDKKHDLLSAIPREDFFLSLSDMNKLTLLLNSYPRQTAKYLRNAFEKRKQFLYVNNNLDSVLSIV